MRPSTLASSETDVARFFKALADDTRLAVVRLLSLTDMRAGEVTERLSLPQNVVSYHLGRLRSLGLLEDRRSTYDARDVYYSIDLERLHALYLDAGGSLHPVLATGTTQSSATQAVTDSAGEIAEPLRILFLCTHNSARSQLAEALARKLGDAHLKVYSAGSELSELHPITVRFLLEWGFDPRDYYSKTFDRFLGQEFDYIVTTCDRANESCPVFPGDPKRIHWSLPDPKAIADSEEQLRAFQRIHWELETRIRYLLALPHPRTGERVMLAPSGAPAERS